MTPSLLVMVGTGKLTDALSAQWIEHVDRLREAALPMIAVSPDPAPSVLLDTEQRSDLHRMIRMLRSANAPDLAFLASWCALIASDLSVAETFLLIKVIRPTEYTIVLRFHLLRHHSTLARIEQTRQLTLCTTSPQESVLLDLDIPDLGEQLAQVHLQQTTLATLQEE